MAGGICELLEASQASPRFPVQLFPLSPSSEQEEEQAEEEEEQSLLQTEIAKRSGKDVLEPNQALGWKGFEGQGPRKADDRVRAEAQDRKKRATNRSTTVTRAAQVDEDAKGLDCRLLCQTAKGMTGVTHYLPAVAEFLEKVIEE